MPQRGSEIRAVNGRGAAAILQEFKGLVSSDGANDGWKTALINSAFARYYALRFGFPGEFVVEARPTGQKTVREVRLQPVDLSKVPGEPSGTKPLTSSGDPNLDLKILPGETSAAVLTIGSFSYYQEVDKFKGFIDESFDRIRKAGVRHLILDLRDNDGGDPFCTTHLLSYLEPRPVPYFARVYPSPYEPFAEPIPRAAGAFEGKLVVLVNAGCFSSTGHFCALLRFHKIGTFIGTETGGTYECNDARREIHLERTRLRLFVARMAFAAAVQSLPRYRGIVPDIVVEPSIADELAGKDPVLERALAIIAGGGGFE
jgi:C-terminal processing protease CtpA/Prc